MLKVTQMKSQYRAFANVIPRLDAIPIKLFRMMELRNMYRDTYHIRRTTKFSEDRNNISNAQIYADMMYTWWHQLNQDIHLTIMGIDTKFKVSSFEKEKSYV